MPTHGFSVLNPLKVKAVVAQDLPVVTAGCADMSIPAIVTFLPWCLAVPLSCFVVVGYCLYHDACKVQPGCDLSCTRDQLSTTTGCVPGRPGHFWELSMLRRFWRSVSGFCWGSICELQFPEAAFFRHGTSFVASVTCSCPSTQWVKRTCAFTLPAAVRWTFTVGPAALPRALFFSTPSAGFPAVELFIHFYIFWTAGPCRYFSISRCAGTRCSFAGYQCFYSGSQQLEALFGAANLSLYLVRSGVCWTFPLGLRSVLPSSHNCLCHQPGYS